MKKIIGIGLVTAALLAGCGGASTGTDTTGTGAGSAANTTAVTGADGAVANPTLDPSADGAGNIAPDATAATNATAVSEAGATTIDATAQATPQAATNTGDAPGASGNTTDNNGTAGAPNTSTTDGSTTTGGSTSGDTTSGSSGAVSGAYQPAGVPDLGLSFQIPEGWEQVNGENAWSPAGVDVPRVGVNSADLTADWRPSSFLPEGATVKSSQQTMVNGQQAMLYTVENSDGTAETHAIIRSGEKAFDIYARAESLQELQTIQPVLNDIVGSVQLSGV
jgi:hypothetical protein